ASREQDVERPLDVDRARRQRVLHGARNRTERAEVEDHLDAADGIVDALVAPQLALDHVDVAVEAGQVAAVAAREVVEHPDLVAVLEEAADEVRADEAAAACHQDAATHTRPPPWVAVRCPQTMLDGSAPSDRSGGITPRR